MRRFHLGFMLGVLTPLIVSLALGFFGFLPVRATSEPSSIEASIARKMLYASVAKEAGGMRNPLPTSDETLMKGMQIYRLGCAGCHGKPGKPSSWGTRNFYPRVPQFAEHPPTLDAPEMFLLVKHGIRYSGMGGWEGLASDEEIWTTVTFLSRLKTLPPAVAAEWTGG